MDEGWPFEEAFLGEWAWCLHCERVSLYAEWKEHDFECPLCGGGSALDCWSYTGMRLGGGGLGDAVHPEWPEVPVRGQELPLYPPRGPELTSGSYPIVPRPHAKRRHR